MILLSNPYSIREGVIYWLHHPVPKADPVTFRHLGGDWGRDAERVFVQTKQKKVDAASFQLLNPVFAKDINAAYDREGPIKGADATSFVVLDSGVNVNDDIIPMISARGYARDRNSVFYHDQGFGRATALRGADAGSFVSLRNDYGYDSSGVWFQKSRLPKADPLTWVHLGAVWSADRERIFYAEREVPDVIRESFTVVTAPSLGMFATDCKRFFMAEHVITEEEFWTTINKSFASLEKQFHGAYHHLRGSCTVCNFSGNCYCVRKGHDTGSCERCVGTGKCHVCKGLSRVKSLRQY